MTKNVMVARYLIKLNSGSKIIQYFHLPKNSMSSHKPRNTILKEAAEQMRTKFIRAKSSSFCILHFKHFHVPVISIFVKQNMVVPLTMKFAFDSLFNVSALKI